MQDWCLRTYPKPPQRRSGVPTSMSVVSGGDAESLMTTLAVEDLAVMLLSIQPITRKARSRHQDDRARHVRSAAGGSRRRVQSNQARKVPHEDARGAALPSSKRKKAWPSSARPADEHGWFGRARVQATRAFVRSMADKTALPFVFWDERLSTVAAERALLEMDVSRAKRAERHRLGRRQLHSSGSFGQARRSAGRCFPISEA